MKVKLRDLTEKREMIAKLASDINNEIVRQGHWLYKFEIEYMLIKALDKYILVDEQALRNKLNMVHRKEPFLKLTTNTERYDMSLTVSANVDKKELDKHRKEIEKYLSDYMKDTFCYTLDKVENETEFEDYVKLRKLLEEHGLTDYKSAKAYFDRVKFERDIQMNESLDRYYRKR